jgi:hypothetical protein
VGAPSFPEKAGAFPTPRRGLSVASITKVYSVTYGMAQRPATARRKTVCPRNALYATAPHIASVTLTARPSPHVLQRTVAPPRSSRRTGDAWRNSASIICLNDACGLKARASGSTLRISAGPVISHSA